MSEHTDLICRASNCDGTFHIYADRVALCPVQRTRHMLNKLNITDFSFQNYVVNEFNDDKDIERIKQFVTNDKLNLILHGQNGVGKTHLAYSVIREAIKKNYSVIITTEEEITQHYVNLATVKDTELLQQSKQKIRELEHAHFALIDDFGDKTYSIYTMPLLRHTMDKRALSKHKTIYTTNLKEEELKQKHNSKIISRMNHKCTRIYLAGPDHRRTDQND